MKEKINQFAKGIFEYDKPKVLLTPQSLELSVDAGEVCHSSFHIGNSRNRVMKGMVCTDCHEMLLEEDSFQGEDNEVFFTFRGTYFAPGEVIKGSIYILSDCGTVQLPFSVTIRVPSCDASTGKIKDMLHFTELAKENMPEAVKLFASPHFEAVFLGQDGSQKALYRGLTRGKNPGIAMEEFLVAMHKKVPVQLSVDRKIFQYRDCQESFRDEIALQKDTWGYCEYEIKTDAEFIELERHLIKTTDFVGNCYPLGFVIHPNQMAGGRSFGRILISNPHQRIEIEIEVEKTGFDREQQKQRLVEKQGILQLYDTFLDLQCGKKTEAEYSTIVERIVCNMDKGTEEGPYEWIRTMFQIHLGILNHLEESVSIELGLLEEKKEELFQKNPLFYCAYYYLLALWKKEEAVRIQSVEKIRDCYQSRENHWLVFWFLLKLDEEHLSIRQRQEMILEQLKRDCHSPLIYWELCRLYREAPDRLLELDPEVERSLHWGCCQGMLSEKLLFRYTYLIGRKRNFSRVLLEDLFAAYEQSPSDDILTMICQMLMRDRKVLQEDLKWYALGIERNLKITDLYEYYMYALEDSEEITLPEKVLLYFSYENHLNTSRKAMLYAYIIRNKEKDRKNYDTYYQMMQKFALEQLAEGRISKNLAVVYEEFINEETLDQKLAVKLPQVLFAREIICSNPDITAVSVAHQELDTEEEVPLVQGQAVVSVYTGTAQIFLIDHEGNRYSQSIGYTYNQLLHLEYLTRKCLEYTGDDIRLLLHLYEKSDRGNPSDEQAAQLCGRLMETGRLGKEYRRRIFASLIRYYYEHFEGELLDAQLRELDWSEVGPADRVQFVEYCGIRHCFDKGMEGILEFGYERMDAKRLLQLSADTFRRSLDARDPQLIKLAWYVFRKGQFDENMICYLRDYYTGSTSDMIQIWKAASGFKMDVLEMSERILAQIVFTEELPEGAYEVFFQYYETGYNKKLIRAFLKFLAYHYLVKGWEIPEELFGYFYRDVRVEENRPCLLAALRYMSQKQQLTGEETVFVDYNLHQLCRKNIVFGFYKDFYGQVPLPEKIMPRQYIEYTASPRSEVKIQYRIVSKEGKGEYVTEIMPDVFEGIRVKSVVLFQDELLQYRIVEKREDGKEKKTGTFRLCYEEKQPMDGNGSWYQMLNQMMISREQEERTWLLSQMQEYAERREVVRQLIKPLKG